MAVNPVRVARAFLDIVKAEFEELDCNKLPTSEEKQVAELLFKKFSKITINYQLIDENLNDFGTESSNALSQASSQSSSSHSQDIQNHEVQQTINSKYPAFKDYNYKARWTKQVQSGGSRNEILQEIRMYTLKKFQDAREEFKPVHDRDLSSWALQRAADFPSVRTNFTASPYWIMQFKRTNRISSRKVTKLVSKREIVKQEDVLLAAEEFRKTILELQQSYRLDQIWNTDQVGFTYEYFSSRTLTNTGEKYVFGAAFSPKNCMTHSYTVQYIINAAGYVVGKPFLCLQEPSGKIGDIAKANMFQPPNIEITCSSSGKLTSTHVSYFVEKVIQPVVSDRLLYILDSWTGHINDKIYREASGLHGVDFNLKIIPKHCTPVVQPLDVYFNLQLKYIVKKLYNQAHLLNRRLTTRNDIIRVQSLAHFLISAPIFQKTVQYCFVKAGLLNVEREYFDSVKDVCFSFKSASCEKQECSHQGFVKCSHCEMIVCFQDFYDDFHLSTCIKSPYLP